MRLHIREKQIKRLRGEYNDMIPELLSLMDRIEALEQEKKELQKTMRELDAEINERARIYGREKKSED